VERVEVLEDDGNARMWRMGGKTAKMMTTRQALANASMA
jgi:hypothetical protein